MPYLPIVAAMAPKVPMGALLGAGRTVHDELHRVADSGAGLDPSQLEHAFTRGWSTKPGDRLHGRGLGLALVQQVIARHGGSVAITDPGAVFTVQLPFPRLWHGRHDDPRARGGRPHLARLLPPRHERPGRVPGAASTGSATDVQYADYRQQVTAIGTAAAQQDVDRILATLRASGRPALPKGLSEDTWPPS